MARLLVVVLLFAMMEHSFAFWQAWKNTPNAGQEADIEGPPTECVNYTTDAECREVYTKRSWDSFTGLLYEPGHDCSVVNGIYCLGAIVSSTNVSCPDFEIRYFCSDPAVSLIAHWSLANGPRKKQPISYYAGEYCREQTTDPSDYNVVDTENGTYSLVSAPEVLNYACAISVSNGDHVNLGNNLTSPCVFDPGRCHQGRSTWSVWMKLHQGDSGAGPVTLLSSGIGGGDEVGMSVSLTSAALTRVAVNSSSVSLLREIGPDRLPNGSWFHLAVVIDVGEWTLDVYIDGKLEDGNSSLQVVELRENDTAAFLSESLTLAILSGRQDQLDASFSYCDLTVFQRNLSSAEINQIWECGVLDDGPEVWNIQEIDSTVYKPNEESYRCIYRTPDEMDNLTFVWRLARLSGEGVLSGPEDLKTDNSSHRGSACFYWSDFTLAGDLYLLLASQVYYGIRLLLICEVDGEHYESHEIEKKDFDLRWTPWLDSSNAVQSAFGDNETLQRVLEVYPDETCSQTLDIQCRERYTMKSIDYLEAHDHLVSTSCHKDEGLLCLHEDQLPSRPCPNFEVRYSCIEYKASISLRLMRVLDISVDEATVDCRSRYLDLLDVVWSLYNVTTGLSVHLNGSSSDVITGVSVVTASTKNYWKSKLTIAEPFSKDIMGLYVVCNVSSQDGRPPVYDSLRIDDVFYGTVNISGPAPGTLQYGMEVDLECKAQLDTVHSIDWYRTPLDGNSSTKLVPSKSYRRTAYYGGTAHYVIPSFHLDHNGFYYCDINWGSAVSAVLMLEGPEIPSTMIPTTRPITSSDVTTQNLATDIQSELPNIQNTHTASTSQSEASNDLTTSQSVTTNGLATPTEQSSTHNPGSTHDLFATSAYQSETDFSYPQTKSTEETSALYVSRPITSPHHLPATQNNPTISSDHFSRPTPSENASSLGASSTASEGPQDATGPVTTQSAPCTLTDVVDVQTAIACGEASDWSVEPGELTEEAETSLLEFLRLTAAQTTGELAPQEITAVVKTVLMAHTKLTDQDQGLSIQEDRSILNATENALNAMAKELPPDNCTSQSFQTSSSKICKSPSHRIPIGPDVEYSKTDDMPGDFLLLDVSSLSGSTVTVVAMRRDNVTATIDGFTNHGVMRDQKMTSDDRILINSALLTTAVFVQDHRISVPVNFLLTNNQDLARQSKTYGRDVEEEAVAVCAYEDETYDHNRQWSNWGCRVVLDGSTSQATSCSCNHTTSFAVLMQVTRFQISEADTLAMTWITDIGCSVSIVTLLLTLAVFIYLRDMLRIDRMFIHSNLAGAILIAQVLFIAGIDRTEDRGVCKAVAFLLHLTYLSVFAWMLVEGVHLYRKIIKVYGSENIKMYPYLIVGWGVPLVIVLISFAAGFDAYGTGNSCWLDINSGQIWAFVVPALVVITINMVVLAMVVRIVINSANLGKEKKHDHIRAGIKGAIMLLPVLGLTWVFGILAVDSATIVFQYLFTIFNSFQGLFIFLINCVFNLEVRTAFKRKREKKILSDSSSLGLSVSGTTATKVPCAEIKEFSPPDDTRQSHADLSVSVTTTTELPCAEHSDSTCVDDTLDTPRHNHPKRPHSGKVSPMLPDAWNLENI